MATLALGNVKSINLYERKAFISYTKELHNWLSKSPLRRRLETREAAGWGERGGKVGKRGE